MRSALALFLIGCNDHSGTGFFVPSLEISLKQMRNPRGSQQTASKKAGFLLKNERENKPGYHQAVPDALTTYTGFKGL
jgi:hypothetical protein